MRYRYIKACAKSQDADLPRLQVIGNGDVFDNEVETRGELKGRITGIAWKTAFWTGL